MGWLTGVSAQIRSVQSRFAMFQNEVKKEVDTLLALKAQYKDLTGEDLAGGGRKDKKDKKKEKEKKPIEKAEEKKPQDESKDGKKVTRWEEDNNALLVSMHHN